MLRKLLKHEFKSTAKLMLLIYGMFLVITLIGTLVLSNDKIRMGQTRLANTMLMVLIIFYVLSVFALFIITYVYMCLHFYKTMYSDQGYLTHTLPVKSSTIFHVKLGTSLVWMLCSMTLLLLSIFLLVVGGSHGSILSADTMSALHDASLEFQEVFDMPMSALFAHMIFSMVLSCLLYLLWIFASASIGQLFSQYKVVAAIITGVILYFIQQIAAVVIMFASGYFSFMTDALTYDGELDMSMHFINNLFLSGYLWSILFGSVLYIVCRVIIKKHLNLE